MIQVADDVASYKQTASLYFGRRHGIEHESSVEDVVDHVVDQSFGRCQLNDVLLCRRPFHVRTYPSTALAHPLPPSLLFATLVLTRPASKQTTSVFIRSVPKRKSGLRK